MSSMTRRATEPVDRPSARVLGLFAKQPLPGQVKTRLAADSTPEWAARVAEALLLDAVERWSAVAARRVLAFAPPSTGDYFAQLVHGQFALVPQSEGDLGRRMAAFFAAQFEAGARSVVLIGTDSPTLPVAFVEQAFQALQKADVVLGPATDGGYYLIGCAERVPPVFEGIAWGSEHVLAETVARLADPAWRLALLPPWYDVDTLADWCALRGHLAALRRAGVDPGVPRTQALAERSGGDNF
jgi:rSAM/selenodomain-associated transferase 1